MPRPSLLCALALCAPLACGADQAAAPNSSTTSTALLASQCANCHSSAPANASIPSLAGHSAAQLLARLQAFQTDAAVPATVMPRLVKALTPEELQALAQWFDTPDSPPRKEQP